MGGAKGKEKGFLVGGAERNVALGSTGFVG